MALDVELHDLLSTGDAASVAEMADIVAEANRNST
jgi:hypothetical protein